MSMIYPEYTTDPIYQTLLSLADSAGIKVKYKELEKPEAAHASWNHPGEISVISMHSSYDYQTQEYANFALAHEMAHCLVDGFYSSEAHYLYPDNEARHRFIEADADKVGAAIYSLAERIACYEQTKKFITDTE